MRKSFSPNIVRVPRQDKTRQDICKAGEVPKEDKIRKCISNIGA